MNAKPSLFAAAAALLLLVGAAAIIPTPTQAGPTTTPGLKVAFIGDQGLNSNSVAVLNLIKNEGAHMVIHSGDFDYADNPTAWDNQINSVLGANYPYFASVGNHDTLRWTEYQQKLQDRLGRVTGAVCTGDLGVKSSCHYQGLFFILSGVGTLGTGHETYIRDQLAADDSVWSICSWHKNQQAMQVGGKTNEVGWGAYEECRLGGGIIATAHEHSYARTKTLVDTDAQIVDPAWPDPGQVRVAPGSTFVFHSGLGGQSIRDQLRCLPTTYPYGCKGEWASIYTNQQAARPGALFCTFNVGGQADRADCYFKATNGAVPDSFTVTSQMGGNPPPACADGVDNDADGLVDYPADPGCTSSTDTDEFNAPAAACADGLDNDADGLVDYPADPGCSSATDNDETNAAGISLAANGYKVKGVQKVDLTWSGATGGNVDVHRNGALAFATPNDGAHTDSLGKGSGSYTYKVCNTGTATCSNTVTVSF